MLALYKLNEKLEARGPAECRLDKEDRLEYIRECKQRLGLNDSILLKTSGRTLID